jgi:hypothetical protein
MASMFPNAWSTTVARVPGIRLYTVNDALLKDPPGTLRAIATIGYREVETAGFAGSTASEFRKMVMDAGLNCPCAHLDFGMKDAHRLLDDARSLGVHYVVSSVLLPSPPPTEDDRVVLELPNRLTLDDFKRVAQLANQIGEKARNFGDLGRDGELHIILEPYESKSLRIVDCPAVANH